MRFHQSLDYVQNINELNSLVGDNNNGNIGSNNINSDNNSSVKTFTSNGNHQAVTKSISNSQNETDNFNFLSNYRNDSVHRNHNNLTIEALTQALTSTATSEHVESDAILTEGGNRFHGNGKNSILNTNGNAVDECGDLSDIETNINHMITRGNLYKLNFDAAGTELDLIERNLSGSIECLASSPDDSFMEDDGTNRFRFFFIFPTFHKKND